MVNHPHAFSMIMNHLKNSWLRFLIPISLLIPVGLTLLIVGAGCETARSPIGAEIEGEPQSSGPLEVNEVDLKYISPDFPSQFAKTMKVEKWWDGFEALTGAEWVDTSGGGYLLFCEPPTRSVWKWRVGRELVQVIRPDEAGEARTTRRPVDQYRSDHRGADLGQGWTRLVRHEDGEWFLCDPEERVLKRFRKWTAQPEKIVVDRYRGRRLQGPEDLAFHPNGDLFFTDSALRAPEGNADPYLELTFNGVYRWSEEEKEIHLVTSKIAFPRGIAISQDGTELYVSNFDPSRPIWARFSLNENNEAGSGSVILDATDYGLTTDNGAPAGMTVHSSGLLFATGPGGIFVLDSANGLVGKIPLEEIPTHCVFDTDEKWLYVTTLSSAIRIRVGK